MNEIDLYQWVHERFAASALLKDYQLVTRDLADDGLSYIRIHITDYGRGCYMVSFTLHSTYHGQKEAALMTTEIQTILGNGRPYSWSLQKPIKTNTLIFKVKYLSERRTV